VQVRQLLNDQHIVSQQYVMHRLYGPGLASQDILFG
jgi:hypothetical protein